MTTEIGNILEVVDGAKVLKMFLFRCKSCLNNITRCFMKFEAKWTTPVVWAEIRFKFGIACSRIEPPHSTQGLFFHLKTRQEYFFYDQESFDMLKRILWNLVFHPFGTPSADFL